MKRIFAIGDIQVDEQDAYLLEKYSWHLKDGLYPRTRIKGKAVYLYQLILTTNNIVDHIDRNPLNNKRSNLRIVTKSQNAMNTAQRKDTKSGIKGVSWKRDRKKWEVYINFNKKRVRLGYYDNIEDAAMTRIEAEKQYYGEFANKEYIEEIQKKYGKNILHG